MIDKISNTGVKSEFVFTIYLQPGAKKSGVIGTHDGHIKIKVNSPPVDGKANEALILFLSNFLNIPKSNIKILSGEKSRIKKLSINEFTDLKEIKNKLMIK